MSSLSKSKPKASGGAPSWMVTFADLMALLLTLFVLLLSFATMETQRFKDLSGNLRDAFGFQMEDMLTGFVERGGTAVHTAKTMVLPAPVSKVLPVEEQAKEPDEALPPAPAPAPSAEEIFEKENLETFSKLQTAMADEIESAMIDVVVAEGVTIVRFPDQVSFASGSGDLLFRFLPVLEKIVTILEESEGHIVISGHTDDIPITTDRYRSNWDLSAARAASVAHYLLEFTSIPAARITVQGYADSRPLVPNTSPGNRAQNRRVEISIQRDETVPAVPDSTSENPEN